MSEFTFSWRLNQVVAHLHGQSQIKPYTPCRICQGRNSTLVLSPGLRDNLVCLMQSLQMEAGPQEPPDWVTPDGTVEWSTH